MKSTMTADFLGAYDYPAEEAEIVVESFIDYSLDYTHAEMVALAAKEKAHWVKTFGNDEQGRADLARFIQVFNEKFGNRHNITM